MSKTALVIVRRCVDYTVHIRIKSDGSDVETAGVKMSINPFDEIAVQEAVNLKSQGHIDAITILGIGEKQVQDTIRHGLAMGADNGIYIASDTTISPLELCDITAQIARDNNVDLILLGKQSIDDDYGQETFMLSEKLGWNCANAAANIDIQNDQLNVDVETDEGLKNTALSLPAIISADLRLTEPQKIPLPKVIAARKITLQELNLNAFSALIKPAQEIHFVESPRPRDPVTMLDSIDDVATKIKEALS